MREAVICEPLRTAVGGFGGVFRDVPVGVLASSVIAELMRRTSIPPEAVEDVIFGQGYPNGEAPAIGRVAALDAGLPVEVPGLQIDRRCGAGLQAITLACMQVQTGASELVLAGGAESMSQAEFYATGMRWGVKGGRLALEDRLARPRVTAGGVHHEVPGGMIETAETLRRRYQIPRAEQDEFALRSHERAVAAQQDGTFAEEIVPIEVKTREGPRTIDRDEHPRADTTLEKLASLKPLHPELDHPTVTAGNAAGLNDAAAAVVVTSDEYAQAHGIAPLARIRSWASVGVEPERTGLAPTVAIPKALALADLKIGDIELFEINEAFCTMAVASSRILGIDHDIVNVNGSGCGLGHPIAATGARMVVSMVHELRRRGQTLGVVSMCAGGGMGSAMVIELL
jgi:acetyl-CoA C-acetyltransferase